MSKFYHKNGANVITTRGNQLSELQAENERLKIQVGELVQERDSAVTKMVTMRVDLVAAQAKLNEIEYERKLVDEANEAAAQDNSHQEETDFNAMQEEASSVGS